MFFKKKKVETDFEWRDFREKSYEELEFEVDTAYGQEMRKRNIKRAILIIALLFICQDIVGFWLKFGVPPIPSYKTSEVINLLDDPIEQPLEEEGYPFIKYETLEDKDHVDIRKQMAYSISGRVVAKNYLFWGNYLPNGKRIFQSAALFDLGLVWGKLSDKEVLKNYAFYNSKDTQKRRIYPTLKIGVKRAPLNWPYVRNHMLNVNIIPANKKVMSALIYAMRNQEIKLDGYLVDIRMEDGNWKYCGMSKFNVNPNARSSESEIMFVTKVQVGDKVYE